MKRRRKGVAGRPKGSKGEIEVAKLLEAWWRKMEPECCFVRTPLSGGWGRPQHREGFGTAGDLMTTAEHFPFAVEVKRREGWKWETLEVGKPSPIWEWWRQTQKAANEMKKRPLFFFRHNREEWHLFLPSDLDGRLPVTSTPRIVWEPEALLGVDYGQELPICYEASMLLELPPGLFLESAIRPVGVKGLRR